MFIKYANNLLKDLSDRVYFKSFTCSNEDDSELLYKIAERINSVLKKTEIKS